MIQLEVAGGGGVLPAKFQDILIALTYQAPVSILCVCVS